MPKLASQILIAFSSMAWNTGSSSPGELEMTLSTSEVAVCCPSQIRTVRASARGLPKSEDQPPSKGLPGNPEQDDGARCRAVSRFLQGLSLSAPVLNLSAPCNGFCCVEAMFEGVFIALRGSWRHSAVHPASAVRHRWRLARLPVPCSGSAPRAEVHGQFVSHSVGRLFSPTSPEPEFRPSLRLPVRQSAHGHAPRSPSAGLCRDDD